MENVPVAWYYNYPLAFGRALLVSFLTSTFIVLRSAFISSDLLLAGDNVGSRSVTQRSLDELRQELRQLGYLSHGIERWFVPGQTGAGSPWRTLLLVLTKAAFLGALFMALPLTAVMLLRNFPVEAASAVLLSASYAFAAFLILFIMLLAVALLLRLRPSLGIQRPFALTLISMLPAGLACLLVAAWWWSFRTAPDLRELILGGALIFALFVVSTYVSSAALLTLSIQQTGTVPSHHQKRRGVPLTIGGVIILALILLPTLLGARPSAIAAPQQVPIRQNDRRMALLAVDGLTQTLFDSTPTLRQQFVAEVGTHSVGAASPAELWASIGTGTEPETHQVFAVDGVKLIFSDQPLQSTSALDPVLRQFLPSAGAARLVALRPTLRRRAYIWEVLASRGVTAVSVGWWASEDLQSAALSGISQETLFLGTPRELTGGSAALAVDQKAGLTFRNLTDRSRPRMATIYLPALDIVNHRLAVSPTERIATSIRLLSDLSGLVAWIRSRGFDVLLVGTPGDGSAPGVIASTFPLLPAMGQKDVAPTVYDFFGFPATEEMKGRSRLPDTSQTRLTSYGSRQSSKTAHPADDEYYEKLRALGYIQ